MLTYKLFATAHTARPLSVSSPQNRIEMQKIVEKSKLKDKYIFYPWLKGNNLEFLIHEDQIEIANFLDGFGIVKCKEEFEKYILIEVQDKELLVRKSGITNVLPTPKFKIGDIVFSSDYNKKFKIKERAWHHKKEQYFYIVKGKSKRFFEIELVKPI